MSDKTRKELAALPFHEKVKILEMLRDRERLIAPVREKLKAERLRQEQENSRPSHEEV